jgi:hypothetical protein
MIYSQHEIEIKYSESIKTARIYPPPPKTKIDENTFHP